MSQEVETDGNFAQLGYESSYVLVNLGSLQLLVIVQILAMAIFAILRLLYKTKRWAKTQLQKIFFNGILAFFEGTILVLLVMCSINISKAKTGDAPVNSSFWFAIVILLLCLANLLVVTSVLC